MGSEMCIRDRCILVKNNLPTTTLSQQRYVPQQCYHDTNARVCTLGYPGTNLGYFCRTRVCTRVPLVYLGTKSGCFGHTRVYVPGYLWCTRQPKLVGLAILGYVPGCLWCTQSSTLLVLVILVYVPAYLYPRTKPGCFGHARVCARVPLGCPGRGNQTWLFGSYSGYVPGYQTWLSLSCSDRYTRVPLE